MGYQNSKARYFLLKLLGGNTPSATESAAFESLLASDGVTGRTAATAVPAGKVGETLAASVLTGAAVALTTATPLNVTSVVLTPGSWVVEGHVNYNLTGATQTASTAGISLVTNTLPADASVHHDGLQTTTATAVNGITVGGKAINVSANTTVYLVASATFSAGTEAAWGQIAAHRVA